MVYAGITGYGDSEGLTGPYSNWPANNMAIQAMSGWMDMTGDPDGAPQRWATTSGTRSPAVGGAEHRAGAGDAAQDGAGAVHRRGDVRVHGVAYREQHEPLPCHRTGPGRSHDRMATAGVTFRAKDGYVVLAGARSEERCARCGRQLAATTWPRTPFPRWRAGRGVLRQRVRARNRAVVSEPD